MSKMAVVYWSGTGNTETMAKAVAAGARAAGADVELVTAADFDAAQLDTLDGVAFGCPAMGCEQLEENEFEPMFAACAGKLGGKRVGLFGSYGWGNGEWMQEWEETCRRSGALLAADNVICNGTPDEAALAAGRALGAAVAE